ncbi:MAG: MFS transporter [Chitinivibrionales bacterium]|nr:MFS transporter [Chitinivibrionales bacterium]
MSKKKLLTREVWAYGLYDWANSAFVMTVTTAFFPAFFKRFWCVGVDETISTARLGYGNMAAGLVIALCSPLLGAFAGAGKSKKRLLAVFMTIGACMAGVLYLIPQGNWLGALGVFLAGRIGFSLANLFYDSLLVDVSDNENADRVSSFGYGIGYLGCGLLFAVHLLMYQMPQLFGIKDGATAIRIAFVTVMIWWILFSLPILTMVKQREAPKQEGPREVVMDGLRRLRHTTADILQNRNMLLFLVAYWCYIDGVHTVYMMATDFGLSLGIDTGMLMVALLCVQFVAFPSAIGFGALAGRIGAKKAILIAVGIYLFITIVGAWILKTAVDFFVLACLTGVAQGAAQALSRSFFAKMVPPEKAADYFGFYNLMGKFAVVLGPGIVATANLIGRALHFHGSASSRFGITTLAVMFVIGGGLLLKVKEPQSSGG